MRSSNLIHPIKETLNAADFYLTTAGREFMYDTRKISDVTSIVVKVSSNICLTTTTIEVSQEQVAIRSMRIFRDGLVLANFASDTVIPGPAYSVAEVTSAVALAVTGRSMVPAPTRSSLIRTKEEATAAATSMFNRGPLNLDEAWHVSDAGGSGLSIWEALTGEVRKPPIASVLGMLAEIAYSMRAFEIMKQEGLV